MELLPTRVLVASLLATVLAGTAGCLGPADECTEGSSRCEGDQVLVCAHECSDLYCYDHWQGVDACFDGRTCVLPTGQLAMCVESTVPDPRCGSATTSSYCTGDSVALCGGDLRKETIPCGALDDSGYARLPGGMGATHCLETAPGAATCVPPEATPDPICAGASGPQCQGDTLIECVSGLLVSRTPCAVCAVAVQSTYARGECSGFLGDTCRTDGDCAAALTCRTDSSGVLRCTSPCSGPASLPSDSIPKPSPMCTQILQDGGPSPSGYIEAPLPNVSHPRTVLACVGGFREWLVR